MDDLLNEFLTETAESIDEVDVQLVELEQDPNNKAVLDNIFRLVHTIKGTCGFLGLPRLESVAHAAENVLGQFRDGLIVVTQDSVTVILESLDRIKEILVGLEEKEVEPKGDDKPLIARLDAIITGDDAPADKAPDAEPAIVVAEKEEDLRPGEVSLDELEAAFANAPGPDDVAETSVPANDQPLIDRVGGDDTIAVCAQLVTTRVGSDSVLKGFFGENFKDQIYGLLTSIAQQHHESAGNIAEIMIKGSNFGDAEFDQLASIVKSALSEVCPDAGACNDFTAEMELTRAKFHAVISNEVSTEVKATAAVADTPAGGGGEKKKLTQNIRVNVDLLEDLMNMVSELVLTRNQMMQMVRNMGDTEFSVPMQRLSQCTTELQESIMKTRMQPIGNAWNKLPRIIRDLSVELDKKIELVMIGAETELDRQVLELIKDPLTHMVRNSADHGIEMPAERLAVGKKEKGTVTLNAYHEGGHIIIEISDDGKGLGVEKLRKNALKKGFISESELDTMSDAQIQKLILRPGFSTAEAVTSVSGRGVGMDVVRTNIEKIGGTIDMTSVDGKGTTFLIKIPLTLAIVSALVVSAQDERFAIPQISVVELVRAAVNSEYVIEHIKETPVLRLRNRLLPLVYLNEILGFSTQDECSERSKGKDEFVVVTQVGNFTYGIVVDAVYDTEEIVVKPVAPILKDLSIYSGNTILGDGSVIMILDPNGVAAEANAHASQGEEEFAHDESAVARDEDRESMLVFVAGNKNQKAVPLALVARLEDFNAEEIEETDGKFVVQYRGALMPLVMVDSSCEMKREGRQGVLVFADGDRVMGVAVDKILDIVDDKLDVEISSNTEGYIGSGVIGGKATEILDVAHYLGLAFADRAWTRDANAMAVAVPGTHLLLIDDSSFFRNMLKPMLQATGYKVTTAQNADEALEYRDKGEEFDLIISDIEMPGMDGFELAEEVKSKGIWADTPLVALSNRATERDLEKGREVGFVDYVAKFDRDALLQSISQQIKLRGDAA
jgi:two-component system chemotaxis sensor kinase CheA